MRNVATQLFGQRLHLRGVFGREHKVGTAFSNLHGDGGALANGVHQGATAFVVAMVAMVCMVAMMLRAHGAVLTAAGVGVFTLATCAGTRLTLSALLVAHGARSRAAFAARTMPVFRFGLRFATCAAVRTTAFAFARG